MTVDPISPLATTTPPPLSAGPKPLGKDAFLSLLVAQLQHQDPTAPEDDSAFIAQLAQFSSLEKLTTIDTSLIAILKLLQPADTDTDTSTSAGPLGASAITPPFSPPSSDNNTSTKGTV